MRIAVDSNCCQGHALCAMSAPKVYTLADDGYNRMGEFEVAAGSEEEARQGADHCPEQAITIIESAS